MCSTGTETPRALQSCWTRTGSQWSPNEAFFKSVPFGWVVLTGCQRISPPAEELAPQTPTAVALEQIPQWTQSCELEEGLAVSSIGPNGEYREVQYTLLWTGGNSGPDDGWSLL